MKILLAQSCPTLCNCMDHSLPGSSAHEILQTGILEWVAIPFSKGSSPTQGSNLSHPHWEQILYHLSNQRIMRSIFFFLNTLFFICFSVTVSVSFVYLKDLPLAGHSESIFNVFSHHLDFVTLKLHPLAFVFFTNHKCEHWTICFRMTHCCCCCC